MKTSNSTNGYYWKTITPASLVLGFVMFMVNSHSFAQSFEALDPAMLEFLQLFEADEEAVLDMALDEASQNSADVPADETTHDSAEGE